MSTIIVKNLYSIFTRENPKIGVKIFVSQGNLIIKFLSPIRYKIVYADFYNHIKIGRSSRDYYWDALNQYRKHLIKYYNLFISSS